MKPVLGFAFSYKYDPGPLLLARDGSRVSISIDTSVSCFRSGKLSGGFQSVLMGGIFNGGTCSGKEVNIVIWSEDGLPLLAMPSTPLGLWLQWPCRAYWCV